MTTLHPVPSRNDPPPIRTGPMGKTGPGAAPWETEFPKDVWHARALGINARSQVTVHLENITRPWLKQLAKQWARWRLTTGLTIESAVQAPIGPRIGTRKAAEASGPCGGVTGRSSSICC